MSKRWECTVCGYIHEGSEPPENCPVCGADRSKFVLLQAEQRSLLSEGLAAFKLHPVLAHFPNGLMPTAALFLLLSFVIGQPGLEMAAFWLVLTLTAVVPVSIGSGLHDWHKYFGWKKAPIFYKKIFFALTLLILGLLSISLRYGEPELLTVISWQGGVFLLCWLGMLGCVTLLGHYGSLLALQTAASTVRTDQEQQAAAANQDDWPQIIVAQAPDAILAADTKGLICLWNRGAEQLFAVPASEAIGQSLDLIIPENLRQRHWQGWGKVMATGHSRYGESELLRVPALRGDGRRFSAEFSLVMLKNRAGEITGVAAILRDVNEQWEREKQLKAQLESCQKQS